MCHLPPRAHPSEGWEFHFPLLKPRITSTAIPEAGSCTISPAWNQQKSLKGVKDSCRCLVRSVVYRLLIEAEEALALWKKKVRVCHIKGFQMNTVLTQGFRFSNTAVISVSTTTAISPLRLEQLPVSGKQPQCTETLKIHNEMFWFESLQNEVKCSVSEIRTASAWVPALEETRNACKSYVIS